MERRRPLLPLLALLAILATGAAGCGGATGSSTVLDSTASPGAPAPPPSTILPATSVGSSAPTTSSLTPASTTVAPVGTVTAPPASSSAAAPGVPAELRIRIWERGRKAGAPTERTLTCGAASAGTVEDPAAACAQLARVGVAAFAPVGADRVCTMIFGGSSEATIDGTYAGQPVSASYSLRNGCEIARWNQLSTILAAHAPGATSVTP